MSGPRAFGGLTIRSGRSPEQIRRDVLQAMRRHLAGRTGLSPADREAAARAATDAVLARLRRRGTGR